MKFTVSSTYLFRHLQILSGAINASATIPILEHFLFEIKKDELKITASDNETMLSATIGIESQEEESVCIPQKLLLETIRTFPEQVLTFSFCENRRLEIKAEQGIYEMNYEKGKDFPELSSEGLKKTNTVLPSKLLLKGISSTLFAMSNDSLRPAMTGAHIEFDPEKGIAFVATDTFKLVRYSREDINPNEKINITVPRKPLSLLKSFLSDDDTDVQISYNENNVRFVFKNIVMTACLINAKYPNYRALLVGENPNKLCIDRNALLTAFKRSKNYANKNTYQVCLDLTKNSLKITCQDADYAHKAEETLPCSYEGEEMNIDFNIDFLMQALQNTPCQDISIELSTPSGAGFIIPVNATIEGEKMITLVMPLSPKANT